MFKEVIFNLIRQPSLYATVCGSMRQKVRNIGMLRKRRLESLCNLLRASSKTSIN